MLSRSSIMAGVDCRARRKGRRILTQEKVTALFECNYSTGVLTWKTRQKDEFASSQYAKAWNTRHAGKIAGSLKGHVPLVCIDYVIYMQSLVVWVHAYGAYPKGEIDHKDVNPLNNALSNLRDATRSQNAANRRIQSNNKTGAKGVSWNEKHKRWVAYISVNGKMRNLGSFLEKDDAANAFSSAHTKAFGEFARLK
jgi:hypothetical protein